MNCCYCRSSKDTFSRSRVVAISKVSQWSREFWLQAVFAFCFTEVTKHNTFSYTFASIMDLYLCVCVFCCRLTLFRNGWTGTPCFRGHGRRTGERRRKSVRGCIVSPDLSVLNLVIVKKGENDLPGLTDTEKPRMRGPKRASKIRKLFNLKKEDDVRTYVNTYRRKFTNKKGETLNLRNSGFWITLEK